jgi:hypothetical protein
MTYPSDYIDPLRHWTAPAGMMDRRRWLMHLERGARRTEYKRKTSGLELEAQASDEPAEGGSV